MLKEGFILIYVSLFCFFLSIIFYFSSIVYYTRQSGLNIANISIFTKSSQGLFDSMNLGKIMFFKPKLFYKNNKTLRVLHHLFAFFLILTITLITILFFFRKNF